MLTVDVGNSSVGVGRWRGEVLSVERFSTPEDAARGLALRLAEVRVEATSGSTPRAAAISVSPPRWTRLLDALDAQDRADLVLLSGAPLPLRDERLAVSTGADRFANALAVLPGPAIAVDAGTAVTVDLVDATSTYCGGFIAPGPGVALFGLAERTAALPLLRGDPVPIRPGLSTEEALAAGGWGLVVGGVDRLVGAARAVLGPQTRVVVTGAWGSAWMAMSALDGLSADEGLVHRGIRRWAEHAEHGAG